jgi:branched-subunit amino acid aminotransferase/4-amino-4-deoxychorismate lyase
MIPTTDRGLTLGDGLFETILSRDGELVLLEAHLDRMARGCETLGLPSLDRARAQRLCEEAAANVSGRAAVRLTLTAGSGGRGLDRLASPSPRLFATGAPAPAPQTPATLVTATVRRNEGSPASRLKTLSYLDNVLAREEASAAGADEALMLNNQGHVACAAAANIFWLEGERLVTPALQCGVLDGFMRAKTIESAGLLGVAVEESCAESVRLEGAEAIFLTSSLIGPRPVGTLNGKQFGPSAVTSRLAVLLQSFA